MKKVFLVFGIIITMLFCGISIYAADVDDSGVWEYQSYEEGVEITKYNGTQTDVYIPGKIAKEGVEYPVLKLGNNLFAGNAAINSATLSEGILEIGNAAFENAKNLVCIVTPQSLTKVGENAFAECASFNSVILYDEVIYIGENAFEGCDNLTIYCGGGKTAHNYALKNGMRFSLIGGSADPEMYTYNNITYDIIDGQASLVFCSSDLSGVVIIPPQVEGFPVTSIYNSAFKEKTGITKVVLPNSILSIKAEAFSGCSRMKEINFPDSLVSIELYAFEDCIALGEAILPEGITQLGMGAFEGCSSLRKASVPDNIESMDRTFIDCRQLTEVKLPKKLKNMKGVFYSCSFLENVTIPNSVETMTTVFPYCSSLKSVTLPANLKRLGDGLFRCCTSLEKVVIPEGTLTIGDSPFEYCGALKEIHFPKSIETIEGELINTYWGDDSTNPTIYVYDNTYAYQYIKTKSFEYVVLENEILQKDVEYDGITYTIKDGEAYVKACSAEKSGAITILSVVDEVPVTKIGNGAFAYCGNITSITVPSGVTEIGKNAFSNCSLMESISLPDGLVAIGDYAFERCSRLYAVTFPNTVTSIGEGVFKSSGIKSFSIPYGITKVSNSMFENCQRSFSSIYIPPTVKEIGDKAFWLCSGLKYVNIPNGVTRIGENAFESTGLVSVHIPSSVTYVGRCAFSSCAFTEISFPDGITAFYGYTVAFNNNLKKIKLPTNLKSMANCEFQDCRNLSSIEFPESLKELNNYALSGWSGTLHVYKNSFMHSYAWTKSLPYVVIGTSENPEISFGSEIKGNVSYTDKTKAAGVKVEIFYDDGTLKESVTTDANGGYVFTYAEVGRYMIRATDTKGNASSGCALVKRMNVFDVFVSGETELVLKKGYTVSGSVSENKATITLTDTEGNIFSECKTTDGSYTFSNIPNGAYIIKAESGSGSAVLEITVFNSDLTVEMITILQNAASVFGYIEIEDRSFNRYKRNWVNVTIYNSEGIAVNSQKTNTDGAYRFNNLPLGEYSIVAETTEMRSDRKRYYDRVYKLTGYAYVDITEAKAYENINIVLQEENDKAATISGKVTAKGENQSCEVILRNVFKFEIAKQKTSSNGKYSFKNIRDGLYFVTAITKSDGMGYTVVIVRNGMVYGNTNINVYKPQRFYDRETNLKADIPECRNRDDALKHKERISKEKSFYDACSEKEKKQFSNEYIERLNRLCKWIADSSYRSTGEIDAVIENEGTIISSNEINDEKTIEFVINISESGEHTIPDDGIKTKEDYIQQAIYDAAQDMTLVKYYDITFSKNGEKISNIYKNTDTTGKLRITMEIPEEYRGHKNYSFVHMHNGETATLVDLDNDPNTVTFEVDRFSTFALAFSDVEISEDTEQTAYPASISYNSETGFISVSSEEAGILYVVTNCEDGLTEVETYNILAGTTENICALGAKQTAFVWNKELMPLCEKFKISK